MSEAHEVRVSLFDSTTKVFTPSAAAGRALRKALQPAAVSVLTLRRNEAGALEAVDETGEAHSFNAPAAGAVAFVGGGKGGGPLVKEALALWEQAGLPPPPVAAAGAARPADAAGVANILSLLMGQLNEELEHTAADAVMLDRQIAALREELEDCRMRFSATVARDAMLNTLPMLSFQRLPSGVFWDMGGAPEGTQLLPYAGNMVRAVSFWMDNPEALDNGTLTAAIVAREDGAVLQEWEVGESGEVGEAGEASWVTLAVTQDIPYRYRYVDFVLQWRGDAATAPRIALSHAIGDEEGFVRFGGEPSAYEMLALRVWSGEAFDPQRHGRFVIFAQERERLGDAPLSVRLPAASLEKAEKVVERNFEWEWLKVEANHLFLHPTTEGPSIARVDVTWTTPARGITAVFTNFHARAPLIAFALIAADGELRERQLVQAAKGKQVEGVLAAQEWSTLQPQVAQPVRLAFAQPRDAFHLYFLTRVPGRNVSHAHAWFRDLRLLV